MTAEAATPASRGRIEQDDLGSVVLRLAEQVLAEVERWSARAQLRLRVARRARYPLAFDPDARLAEMKEQQHTEGQSSDEVLAEARRELLEAGR